MLDMHDVSYHVLVVHPIEIHHSVFLLTTRERPSEESQPVYDENRDEDPSLPSYMSLDYSKLSLDIALKSDVIINVSLEQHI